MCDIRKEKEGTFTQASPPVKAKDLVELKSLGSRINGALEVSPPPIARMPEHNADSDPGMLSKAYR